MNLLAGAYNNSGQSRNVLPLMETIIEIYKSETTSKEGLATVLGNLAKQQITIGNLRGAETNFRHRITLDQEIENKRDEAFGHEELGRLLSYEGIWDESKREAVLALRLLETNGNSADKCVSSSYEALHIVLINRDSSRSNSSPPKNAILLAQRAIELANQWAKTQYPVERDFVRALWLLGAAYRLDGQLDLAEQHLGEALTRDRAINMVDHEANILLDLARLHYDQKNYEEAKALAEEAFLITERCGYVLQGADVNLFLAQYALEQEKDKVKAKEYAETALKLATCDGPPYYYKVAYEEAERMLKALG